MFVVLVIFLRNFIKLVDLRSSANRIEGHYTYDVLHVFEIGEINYFTYFNYWTFAIQGATFGMLRLDVQFFYCSPINPFSRFRKLSFFPPLLYESFLLFFFLWLVRYFSLLGSLLPTMDSKAIQKVALFENFQIYTDFQLPKVCHQLLYLSSSLGSQVTHLMPSPFKALPTP